MDIEEVSKLLGASSSLGQRRRQITTETIPLPQRQMKRENEEENEEFEEEEEQQAPVLTRSRIQTSRKTVNEKELIELAKQYIIEDLTERRMIDFVKNFNVILAGGYVLNFICWAYNSIMCPEFNYKLRKELIEMTYESNRYTTESYEEHRINRTRNEIIYFLTRLDAKYITSEFVINEINRTFKSALESKFDELVGTVIEFDEEIERKFKIYESMKDQLLNPSYGNDLDFYFADDNKYTSELKILEEMKRMNFFPLTPGKIDNKGNAFIRRKQRNKITYITQEQKEKEEKEPKKEFTISDEEIQRVRNEIDEMGDPFGGSFEKAELDRRVIEYINNRRKEFEDQNKIIYTIGHTSGAGSGKYIIQEQTKEILTSLNDLKIELDKLDGKSRIIRTQLIISPSKITYTMPVPVAQEGHRYFTTVQSKPSFSPQPTYGLPGRIGIPPETYGLSTSSQSSGIQQTMRIEETEEESEEGMRTYEELYRIMMRDEPPIVFIPGESKKDIRERQEKKDRWYLKALKEFKDTIENMVFEMFERVNEICRNASKKERYSMSMINDIKKFFMDDIFDGNRFIKRIGPIGEDHPIYSLIYNNIFERFQQYTTNWLKRLVREDDNENRTKIDLIRCEDIEPANFVAKEFDIDVVKVVFGYFDGEFKIRDMTKSKSGFSVFQKIILRTMELDFSPNMTINYHKSTTTLERLKKYEGKGFTNMTPKDTMNLVLMRTGSQYFLYMKRCEKFGKVCRFLTGPEMASHYYSYQIRRSLRHIHKSNMKLFKRDNEYILTHFFKMSYETDEENTFQYFCFGARFDFIFEKDLVKIYFRVIHQEKLTDVEERFFHMNGIEELKISEEFNILSDLILSKKNKELYMDIYEDGTIRNPLFKGKLIHSDIPGKSIIKDFDYCNNKDILQIHRIRNHYLTSKYNLRIRRTLFRRNVLTNLPIDYRGDIAALFGF